MSIKNEAEKYLHDMSEGINQSYMTKDRKIEKSAVLIEKLVKENKRLYGALEAIKISMDLSEAPFYKGMEILKKALEDK